MNLTSNYIEYLIKCDSVIIEFKHFENGPGNLLYRKTDKGANIDSSY